MGLDLRITGSDKLAFLGRQLRAEGSKGLGKEMGRALRGTMGPLRAEIRAEASDVMPESGGYRGVFVPSLRYRTQISTSSTRARVTHKTHADGKGERRDVGSLNRGVLRHPVFGRRRRAWATTTIRAGFWSRPTDRLMPQISARMGQVLDDFIARLKG